MGWKSIISTKDRKTKSTTEDHTTENPPKEVVKDPIAQNKKHLFIFFSVLSLIVLVFFLFPTGRDEDKPQFDPSIETVLLDESDISPSMDISKSANDIQEATLEIVEDSQSQTTLLNNQLQSAQNYKEQLDQIIELLNKRDFNRELELINIAIENNNKQINLLNETVKNMKKLALNTGGLSSSQLNQIGSAVESRLKKKGRKTHKKPAKKLAPKPVKSPVDEGFGAFEIRTEE